MMKAIHSMTAAAATAAALCACAPATEQTELGAPESRTTLVVDNQNWSNVVLYVLRGSTRTRLGSVHSMGKATFRISDTMSGGSFGDVRIVADPIGSKRVYTSPVINIVPGSRVELRVSSHIQISSFAVFN